MSIQTYFQWHQHCDFSISKSRIDTSLVTWEKHWYHQNVGFYVLWVSLSYSTWSKLRGLLIPPITALRQHKHALHFYRTIYQCSLAHLQLNLQRSWQIIPFLLQWSAWICVDWKRSLSLHHLHWRHICVTPILTCSACTTHSFVRRQTE